MCATLKSQTNLMNFLKTYFKCHHCTLPQHFIRALFYCTRYHIIQILWITIYEHIECDNCCICHTLRSWLHYMPAMIRTFSPGLENNDTLKCSSINFPGNIKYFSISAKLLEIHFNVLLFSNQGEKVLFLVESTGQIYFLAFIFLRAFSPGLNSINIYRCSPIQGRRT